MITYSVEKLYHFRCSECNKWWSIGDFSSNGLLMCPYCGHKDKPELEKFTEKNEKDNMSLQEVYCSVCGDFIYATPLNTIALLKNDILCAKCQDELDLMEPYN